jgi:hypothetical protein
LLGDAVREKLDLQNLHVSGLPADAVGRLHEVAPTARAAVMEKDFAALGDLVRNVVVCPDVRLQGVSSFHRRYPIDKGLTFKNVISVSRISSETERVKDRAHRYFSPQLRAS